MAFAIGPPGEAIETRMTRFASSAARPQLPRGLYWCPRCSEPRGTTADGGVSACWCSGFVCNGCGGPERRPITAYYDATTAAWRHVPHDALAAHRCRLAPGEPPRGTGWTRLEPDPDVLMYQEAVTEFALEVMADNDAVDLVDGDRTVGRVRVSRPS